MKFYKYEGTGNDFIMIDNRSQFFPKQKSDFVVRLCHRHFGIGADGLILLENDLEADFRMIYYNSDGNQSSMCGNGGRCIVNFAQKLGIIKEKTNFVATDGLHFATIKNNVVALQMQNVSDIKVTNRNVFLDTGSPHHIIFTEYIEDIDVKTKGTKIRYSTMYKKIGGTNVNFVEQLDENYFAMRTYERGVEDETLSCGTGAVAVAIAMHKTKRTNSNEIEIKTCGGILVVSFENVGENYTNIFLKGVTDCVFEGDFLQTQNYL